MKRSFILILAILNAFCLSLDAQDVIRVQGKVTELSGGSPIPFVTIIVNGSTIGYADEDGKYSVTVSPNAEILFYSSKYEDQFVKVDNRQVIDVMLAERSIKLNDVLIVGKMSKKVIVVENTDLVIVGNYIKLKTKFRVPKNIFTTEKRFIVQPTLFDVTTNRVSYFRPAVIDGKIYNINKNRHLSFDSSRDSLYHYVVENNLSKNDYVYSYNDSIFVERKDIDLDYRADCYLVVNELFERPDDYSDTVTIARGTKYPQRFLDYSFDPKVDLNLPAPKPDLRLVSESGSARVNFLVGKAEIDENDTLNFNSLNEIKDKVSSIINNQNAALNSISIKGFASPEGNYTKNVLLAQRRTETIKQIIISSIVESRRDNFEFLTGSIVEPWSSLVPLMERDSSYLAPIISEIVRETGDDYAKAQANIVKLKEYKTDIANTYLPLLRRVDYTIDYSSFRNLTDDEIWSRYRSGESDISRYEFWRLFETANTDKEKEEIDYRALKDYPNYTLFANRVAVRMIKNGTPSLDILKPCLTKDAPSEIIFNQTLAALSLHEIEQADSLVSLLPVDESSSYLKAIIKALNGDFVSSYSLLARHGGLNEVIILLCLDRNSEATELIKSYGTLNEYTVLAKYWYLRAICSNRMDDVMDAMDSLKKAIEIDPSLEAIAKLDNDVMDILSIIEY